MLGGMREEKVYKVTLMEEKRSEELATDTEKKTTAEKVADVEVEEHQVAYNGNLLRHLILAVHIPLIQPGSQAPRLWDLHVSLLESPGPETTFGGRFSVSLPTRLAPDFPLPQEVSLKDQQICPKIVMILTGEPRTRFLASFGDQAKPAKAICWCIARQVRGDGKS